MSNSWSGGGTLRVVGTCTTGDETGSAPAASSGIDLGQGAGVGVGSVSVAIEMDSGNITGTAPYLRCYHQNPQTGSRLRIPDLDQPLTASIAGQSSVGWPVPNSIGYLSWLPEDVGGACKIYINATRKY